MICAIEGCGCSTARSRDVFCARHWKALPRWARCEMVRLRNAAARGGHDATRSFLQAATAARGLIEAQSQSASE